MRKLVFAALAALALVCPPARAQTFVAQFNGSAPFTTSGSLTTSGDTLTIYISGGQWSTVQFTSPSVGTSTVTAELTIDGTNWAAAPYARRLNVVNANPTTIAFTAITLQAGHVWEIPLPANAVAFRLRCANTGSTTSINTYGGVPYVPGISVIAVLYDVTSGTNAALDTGTLDVSGWGAIYHFFTMNGGTPAFSIAEVDDAGTTLANLITGAVAFVGGIGNQYGSTTIGGTAGIATATSSLPLPKRLRYQSAAIVAQTSRIRLEARR